MVCFFDRIFNDFSFIKDKTVCNFNSKRHY